MPSKYTRPSRENKNAAASNLPVKTFRLGRVKAAAWENEGEQKFYSATFARTYVDDDNKYHDTDSFGRDDLPLVAKLADQAHMFIFEQREAIATVVNTYVHFPLQRLWGLCFCRWHEVGPISANADNQNTTSAKVARSKIIPPSLISLLERGNKPI